MQIPLISSWSFLDAFVVFILAFETVRNHGILGPVDVKSLGSNSPAVLDICLNTMGRVSSWLSPNRWIMSESLSLYMSVLEEESPLKVAYPPLPPKAPRALFAAKVGIISLRNGCFTIICLVTYPLRMVLGKRTLMLYFQQQCRHDLVLFLVLFLDHVLGHHVL